MQKQRLSIRVEVSRIEKLRLYARYKRKTMTQLVEDWIDTRFASRIERGHRVAQAPMWHSSLDFKSRAF